LLAIWFDPARQFCRPNRNLSSLGWQVRSPRRHSQQRKWCNRHRRSPLEFYANRTYLTRYGKPETFSDLRTHRLIGFERELFNIDAARALRVSVTASDFSFRCDSIPAQIEAVRADLGIGILHRGLAARMEGRECLLPQTTNHKPQTANRKPQTANRIAAVGALDRESFRCAPQLAHPFACRLPG